MKWLVWLSNRIDQVSALIGRTISWFAVMMVLVTVYDVIMRYFFRAGSVAVQELEWHLFAAHFLLAASWTLLLNGHVRVDFLHSRMTRRQKALVDIVGDILFLVPFCILVIWASIPFVYHSWVFLEGSSDPGGLPARYLLKTIIPIAYMLICLQGVSHIIKNFLILKDKGAKS